MDVPVYNPCPFGVPAAWVLRVDPFFYGGVAESDGWMAFRSGDPRVPPGGPFGTFQEARQWVVDYARACLSRRLDVAVDLAVDARRALLDVDEESDA